MNIYNQFCWKFCFCCKRCRILSKYRLW